MGEQRRVRRSIGWAVEEPPALAALRALSMNLSRLLLSLGFDSAERDRQVPAALQDIYDEEIQGYRLVGGLGLSLQAAGL